MDSPPPEREEEAVVSEPQREAKEQLLQSAVHCMQAVIRMQRAKHDVDVRKNKNKHARVQAAIRCIQASMRIQRAKDNVSQRAQKSRASFSEEQKGDDEDQRPSTVSAPVKTVVSPSTPQRRQQPKREKMLSPVEEAKKVQAERRAAVKEQQVRNKQESEIRKQRRQEEDAHAKKLASERAADRIQERKGKNDAKLTAADERLRKTQAEESLTWEAKARANVVAGEKAGFQGILRSRKAHWEFLLVDAERIRREEDTTVHVSGNEGMDLLYQHLVKDRPSDSATNEIHEDRRRRVVDLLGAKNHSELMSDDLALRKKYTEDISAEAARMQHQQSDSLHAHLKKSTETQNAKLQAEVKKLQEQTEENRQRRIQSIQEDVEYVRTHGNTRTRIREAEEKRARTLDLKQKSLHIRRGFVKSPQRRADSRLLNSRTSTSSNASRSSRGHDVSDHPEDRSGSPLARDGGTKKKSDTENSADQHPSNDNASSTTSAGGGGGGGDNNLEDPNDRRPNTVPQKQRQTQDGEGNTVAVVDRDGDVEGGGSREEDGEESERAKQRHQDQQRRNDAQQKMMSELEKKHAERRSEVEEKNRQRRLKEKEDFEASVAASKEISKRRQKERQEEMGRQENVEGKKQNLKMQIAEDAMRRRQLDEEETKLLNENLKQRIAHVKETPHAFKAERQWQQDDAKVVREKYRNRKEVAKQLKEEDRTVGLERFLQRHTAVASRQEELVMMREQRKEHCSRTWQALYKAQNERQEVARLQQLMSVRNSAMGTKADSLMAREVSVRNKAVELLQKQQHVAEMKKKNHAAQAGAHMERKLLQQLYSHPPDLNAEHTNRRAKSALDHTTPKNYSPSSGDDSMKNSTSSTIQHALSDIPFPCTMIRSATPQPVAKVLPEKMRESIPSLSNPTPALLRNLEAPDAVKERAWKLFTLVEEMKEAEKSNFVVGIHGGGTHGSAKKTARQIDQLWKEQQAEDLRKAEKRKKEKNKGVGYASPYRSPTSSPSRSRATASNNDSNNSSSPTRTLQKKMEERSGGGVVEDVPTAHHQPWVDFPGRVKSVSDRLTSRSIAQDAGRLHRERLVAVTSLHDGMEKVGTPNARLYENQERREAREARELARKEKAHMDKQLEMEVAGSPTSPKHSSAITAPIFSQDEKDEAFVQRFYNDQVNRHNHKLETSRVKIVQNTTSQKGGKEHLPDEDVKELIGRLTKVRKASDRSKIQSTSKGMQKGRGAGGSDGGGDPTSNAPTKDDPVHPSPQRARLDNAIVERLYVRANRKQSEEADRLHKEYLVPMETKQGGKIKKLTLEHMETSRERLFKGEMAQMAYDE